MFKNNYNVIGVMSGTSLDGIDLAHIKFSIVDSKWDFEILECETVSYTLEWLNKLKNAVSFPEEKLVVLNHEYTLLLGNIIEDFITKNNLDSIDFVSSHGHTILHQPHNGFTLQIGNLPEIIKYTKQNVICDFRVQDVALGGQGAPLVPIGDRLLFSEYDYCLNLGGFSNISFEKGNKRIAFDISPVNTVLNSYANQLGFHYDDKGTMSRTGKINNDLYNQLNMLDYYKMTFPKSLGFEFVKEIILPIINSYKINIEDVLRTFIEHIAFQIATALPSKNETLFVTGGGAYNDFLIERIQIHLPQTKIIIPENKTLEFKEALIFGLLGVLKIRNQVNVLKSVTGAKRDHSSGKIYLF